MALQVTLSAAQVGPFLDSLSGLRSATYVVDGLDATKVAKIIVGFESEMIVVSFATLADEPTVASVLDRFPAAVQVQATL